MSDRATEKTNSRNRAKWVALWLLLATAALLLGPVRIWYALREGPQRTFRAGMEAFAENDLEGVHLAAEGLRDVRGYESHHHLLEGISLLRSARLRDALEEFGQARDHPDLSATAYTLSGEALYKAHRYRDAQTVLAKAIELDPEQVDARRWLAAIYYDIGAMTMALEELEKVAQLAPDDPRPNRLRGLIAKDFEMYQEALPEYRESLRRGIESPERDLVLLELSECLLMLRRYEEAEETVAECPRSARRLAIQAECRHALGDETAARRLVDEALGLEPGNVEATLLRATIALDAGDAEVAARVIAEAIERHPKEFRLHHKLVQTYRRLGRDEEALQEAETTKKTRELVTGFARLHQAAIKDPDNIELRYQLGQAAQELGRPDLARSWFAAVLAMDPQHQGARRQLRESRIAESDTGEPNESPPKAQSVPSPQTESP